MDGKTLYVILSANAADYRRALRGAGGDTREFGDEVTRTGRKIDATGKEIDKLSGRIRLMLDTLILVGPALLPIGAVGVPAVTALANMLGIATVAAGSAMVAFQGVGEALKAIEKADLNPTAENLAEVRRTMSELSPATRDFVRQLDAMGPLLDEIQKAAAEGLMPGATESLRDLESMLVPIKRLMFEYGDVLGGLAVQQADAFDSPRARDFLDFLRREARPAMTNLIGTAANLAAGMSELWMNFDPINDDAGRWFLEQSEAFDRWASRVDETEGFQEFMAYIRTNGPQVADTLGAVADATLQIIEAAAPLGGPALKGIEIFADTVATIADSPVGPTLIQAAAAATLLNRSLQLTNTLMGRMGIQSTGGRAGGVGGAFGAIKTGAASTSTGIRTLTQDLRAMSNEYRRTAQTTKQITPSLFSGGMFGAGSTVTTGAGAKGVGAVGSAYKSMLSQTTAEAQRTKAALTGVAKAAGGAAAGVAAMAVVSTEAGQGLGVTNTAMLGMVGMMAGPWGAALGASVGLLMDLSNTGDLAADSQERLRMSVKAAGLDFEQMNNAIVAGQDSVESYNKDLSTLGKAVEGWDFLLTGETAWDSLSEAQQKAKKTFDETKMAYADVGAAFDPDMWRTATGVDLVPDLQTLTMVAQRAQPAMQALGLTTEDLLAMDPTELRNTAQQIAQWTTYAESADGRTEAFADTVRDLGNEALSTAASAGAMGTALEALLSPALNAEEAYDAWRLSLRALAKEMTGKAGFAGMGDAAVKNRDLTRSYVEDSMKRLQTLAGVSTTTEEQMAAAVQETRKEFIKSGIAAGFSEEAITARANALGLTPKLVRTSFEAAGIDATALAARNLKADYDALPKKVRTDLEANGVPKTKAQIEELTRKYNLTPKQVKTIAQLQDAAAKSGVTNLKKMLGDLAKYMVKPKVDVNVDAAANAIGWIRRALAGIPDEIVNVTPVRRRGGDQPAAADGGIWSGGVRRFAGGGWGSNGRYYHREPMMVNGGANILWGEEETGWEAYISGKPSQRGRNVQILAAAAGRFGYSLAERRGSELVPAGGSSRSTMVVQKMPDRLTLEVDGTKFTAYVRAHAGDVADRKADQRSRKAAANGRMDW